MPRNHFFSSRKTHLSPIVTSHGTSVDAIKPMGNAWKLNGAIFTDTGRADAMGEHWALIFSCSRTLGVLQHSIFILVVGSNFRTIEEIISPFSANLNIDTLWSLYVGTMRHGPYTQCIMDPQGVIVDCVGIN